MKTTIRRRLRSQLVESWKTVLEKQYAFQWINSERSLQAYFATSLDEVLRSTQKAATKLQRRLFIEPTIRIGKGKKVYECKPDIVVCNKDKIIAVIELKYQPKSKPTYQDDIKNLELLKKDVEQNKLLNISNSRYRGPATDSTTYSFAEDTLFVWAGIYNPEKHSDNTLKNTSLISGNSKLQGCFLTLHAETYAEHDPLVFHRSSW